MNGGSPTTPVDKLAAGFLLSDIEVAALLGVSVDTVRNWRWRGGGPRFVKLGARAVRYRPEDVRAFINGGSKEAA
jgi:predicted DNA-binding transcriptional regulator AlpA